MITERKINCADFLPSALTYKAVRSGNIDVIYKDIIVPNINEINARLHQENNPKFLTYMFIRAVEITKNSRRWNSYSWTGFNSDLDKVQFVLPEFEAQNKAVKVAEIIEHAIKLSKQKITLLEELRAGVLFNWENRDLETGI